MAPTVYDSDSNSDSDEEAPLFTVNSNFNSAAYDPVTGENIKGVAYGVRYENSRRKRKDEARARYAEEEMLSSRSLRCISNVSIFVFILLVTIAILDVKHRRKIARVKEENAKLHRGSVASSRWGHRFDDDDSLYTDGRDEHIISSHSAFEPKYHSHNNNPRAKAATKHDLEVNKERWEEYEMEVSHLLSSAGPDWDIHTNPREKTLDEDGDNAEDADGDEYDDHWVRYFDPKSKQSYYLHIETNTTQWDKPEVMDGVVIYGLDYETGEDIVLEGRPHSTNGV